MTIKDSKYVKINSANPLYLMFNKMGTLNGCFQEINENKYLEKYEELWIKIRDLIRSVTKE